MDDIKQDSTREQNASGECDTERKKPQGPRFFVCIEDTKYSWPDPTITTEQIAELGGWDPSVGVIEINLKDNTEHTLEPGEIVELKPGQGFSKKICWKRGDLFADRIEGELCLLRERYGDVTYLPDGQWVLIPSFKTGAPSWTPGTLDVAFQIPTGYPGAPPYGFYVPVDTRYNGALPGNYKEPAPSQPPFEGIWGVFSWSAQDGEWKPGADVTSGSNLVDWVRGFGKRFREGM